MEYNANDKYCCVIGHVIFTDENAYRSIIKSEVEKLIRQGYTKFITYYKPRINKDAIHIIKEIEKQIGISLFIELVIISSSTLNGLSIKKRNELRELLQICDKVTTISDKINKVSMNRFYSHLAAKCNLLLCLEEDFRCEAGKTNLQIFNLFIKKGHYFRVFDLHGQILI